jgi:hypothetical protein
MVAYFRRHLALWQSTFERFLEGLRLTGMAKE